MSKIIIIQLDEFDAERLISLVQREAETGQIYNDYWANVAFGIRLSLEAQRNSRFFQCLACHEIEENSVKTPIS